MKCQQAEDWDRRRYNSIVHYVEHDGRWVPKDRPCDWCGKPVDKGYIHVHCAKLEKRAILDILD